MSKVQNQCHGAKIKVLPGGFLLEALGENVLPWLLQHLADTCSSVVPGLFLHLQRQRPGVWLLFHCHSSFSDQTQERSLILSIHVIRLSPPSEYSPHFRVCTINHICQDAFAMWRNVFTCSGWGYLWGLLFCLPQIDKDTVEVCQVIH